MVIWNQSDVTIWDNITVKSDALAVSLNGLAKKKAYMYEWSAIALQHGWYITVRSTTGYSESFQGSTFNLYLEVASAVSRSR